MHGKGHLVCRETTTSTAMMEERAQRSWSLGGTRLSSLARSRAAAGPRGSSKVQAVRRHHAKADGKCVRALQRSVPLLETGTVKPQMLVKGRIALDHVPTASAFFPLERLVELHHAFSNTRTTRHRRACGRESQTGFDSRSQLFQ